MTEILNEKEVLYEVVKRLTGNIEPVGETHIDTKRYVNLVLFSDLVDMLVRDLFEISQHKTRYEDSMKKAGKYASKQLHGLSDYTDGQ